MQDPIDHSTLTNSNSHIDDKRRSVGGQAMTTTDQWSPLRSSGPLLANGPLATGKMRKYVCGQAMTSGQALYITRQEIWVIVSIIRWPHSKWVHLEIKLSPLLITKQRVLLSN